MGFDATDVSEETKAYFKSVISMYQNIRSIGS